MPIVDGPVRVASVLGEYRGSLSQHAFVGGNAFMLRLMNRFRAELGVDATSAELEAMARATVRQIETQTATVTIDNATQSNGSSRSMWRSRISPATNSRPAIRRDDRGCTSRCAAPTAVWCSNQAR
jgi:hypothetical protein